MAATNIEMIEEKVYNEDIHENLEEEEESFFQDSLMLVEYGVDAEDVGKLKSLGIHTIKGVQMTTRKKLLEISGFDQSKVEKIKEACNKISLGNCFVTALEVCNERKQVFKISTGSNRLDTLLGGGVESMSITEVFGEFRTGKTQLSHTLCVTAQIPGPNGYIGGKVIFIDTENTFRPERVQAIANRFNLVHVEVLKNILRARAYNSEHQFELLNHVAAKLHEEGGLFKLLIIDSIIALFRVDYSGRGEMHDRQRKLGQMMSRLQKISEEYNIAVFITNQVTSDLANLEQIDILKPIGGNILAHASTTRISLHKEVNEVRIAKVYDSPHLAEGKTKFTITTGGISDVN